VFARRDGKRHQLIAHVARKRPEEELSPNELIANRAPKLATDVIEVGRPRAHDLDHTDRVVIPGTPRRGTLSIVARTNGPALALLSGHVCLPIVGKQIMRNYDASSDPAAAVSAVQDDGARYDGVVLVGALGGDLDWALSEFPNTPPDETDPGHTAAFHDAPVPIRRTQLQIGEPAQHVSSMRHKRMTGRIHSFAATPIKLQVGPDIVEYNGVVKIKAGDAPFSIEGDSGSLIVDDARRAWGLVLGGTDDGLFTYALTLPPLINHLGTRASTFFEL
jgi:hypothetical protein